MEFVFRCVMLLFIMKRKGMGKSQNQIRKPMIDQFLLTWSLFKIPSLVCSLFWVTTCDVVKLQGCTPSLRRKNLHTVKPMTGFFLAPNPFYFSQLFLHFQYIGHYYSLVGYIYSLTLKFHQPYKLRPKLPRTSKVELSSPQLVLWTLWREN